MKELSSEHQFGFRIAIETVAETDDSDDSSSFFSPDAVAAEQAQAQQLLAAGDADGTGPTTSARGYQHHQLAGGRERLLRGQHVRTHSMGGCTVRDGGDLQRSHSTPYFTEVGLSNRGVSSSSLQQLGGTRLQQQYTSPDTASWSARSPLDSKEPASNMGFGASTSSGHHQRSRGWGSVLFPAKDEEPVSWLKAAQLLCCGTRSNKASLWRLFAVCIGVLAVLHAISCGVMFFLRMPGWHKSLAELMYDDLEPDTLHSEAKLLVQSEMLRQRYHKDDKIKLIPKIIHQTYKTNVIPSKLKPLMQTWREFNPNYEIRFYDDAACRHFVATEFPEYFEAYQTLPKDVERADFFRYMVVLRYGGIYADVDTECRVPIDNYLRASDTLVVGWENEFASDEQAFARHFVRRRQILQWLFMGVPGHPVLRGVCDHIARVAKLTFSNNTNRDTLERTGPGLWTDMVLRRSFQRVRTAKADDPWGVRILPRVSFGAHPSGVDGVPPTSSSVFALHHYMGSWKVSGGWRHRKGMTSLLHSLGMGEHKDEEGVHEHDHKADEHAPFSHKHPEPIEVSVPPADAGSPPSGLVPAILERAPALEHASEAKRTEPEQEMPKMVTDLFPVSAMWDPPFDIMVLMLGEDGEGSVKPVTDPNAPIESASSSITNWGTWHPGVHPTRRPGLAEALVGSLGGHRRSAVLVDVGAGVGFFSLAAAARGHRAIAFETRPKHVRALRSSVATNGFQQLITVRELHLGSAKPEFCARWAELEAEKEAAAAAAAEAAGHSNSMMGRAVENIERVFGGAHAHADTAPPPVAVAEPPPLSSEVPRGGAAGASEAAGANCTLPDTVVELDAVLPSNVEVGALRLSVHGMEHWVLDGAAKLMAARTPPIVVIELNAPLATASAGGAEVRTADQLVLLHRMWDLGYTDISHSGPYCDRRWHKIASVHRFPYGRGGSGASVEDALKQPTWCKLPESMFEGLVEHTHHTLPETLLFHHMHRMDMLAQERLQRLSDLERSVLDRAHSIEGDV